MNNLEVAKECGAMSANGTFYQISGVEIERFAERIRLDERKLADEREQEMKVGDKLIVDGEEATVMEAKIFWATRCTNAEMELAEIREQLAAAQAMNVDLQTNLSALQELAIWMTGCGYDFARLEFFQHEKYLLSLPPVNLNSTFAVRSRKTL